MKKILSILACAIIGCTMFTACSFGEAESTMDSVESKMDSAKDSVESTMDSVE